MRQRGGRRSPCDPYVTPHGAAACGEARGGARLRTWRSTCDYHYYVHIASYRLYVAHKGNMPLAMAGRGPSLRLRFRRGHPRRVLRHASHKSGLEHGRPPVSAGNR